MSRRVIIIVATLITAAVVHADTVFASPVPRTDRTAPTVTFTTRDGDVRIGLPTTPPAASDLTRVSGFVTDGWTGVRRVRVIFCSGGWRDADGGWGCGSRLVGAFREVTVTAQLACGPLRRRCTSSAPVPLEPEQYVVLVRASDRAGNFRQAGPVLVTVV